MAVPNVPGLAVNIMPGIQHARIDIHPLFVCNDPLQYETLETHSVVQPNHDSHEDPADETPRYPKFGGSLLLGVSSSTIFPSLSS